MSSVFLKNIKKFLNLEKFDITLCNYLFFTNLAVSPFQTTHLHHPKHNISKKIQTVSG